MKNKILITGHKGFLGSYLFKILKKNKNNLVKGKDIDLYSNRRKYRQNFIKTNIRELSKIDTIIHLAGISTNYDPNQNIYKKLSFKANYFDTLELAKKAKKNGIKKFMFASSTSVYGNKNNKIVTEKSSLSPTTSYGKSKKKIEEKLIRMSGPNFKVIILRMVTLFGISKRMRFDLLVNNLISSYITNKKIILTSDGMKIRPQIDLKDAAKVYAYFIKNEINSNYIVLNVGRHDYNLTVAQVAKKISKVLNSKIEFGKKDLDKRSYKVSFKKLNKFISFEKSKNSLEKNAKDLNKIFKKRKKKFFQNKNFHNLLSIKNIIHKGEIKNLV